MKHNERGYLVSGDNHTDADFEAMRGLIGDNYPVVGHRVVNEGGKKALLVVTSKPISADDIRDLGIAGEVGEKYVNEKLLQ